VAHPKSNEKLKGRTEGNILRRKDCYSKSYYKADLSSQLTYFWQLTMVVWLHNSRSHTDFTDTTAFINPFDKKETSEKRA